MTSFQEAPYTNGVMDLNDKQIAEIKIRFIEINKAFVPSIEIPVCDIFYLVSTYNKDYPDTVINGDTAEYILGKNIT